MNFQKITKFSLPFNTGWNYPDNFYANIIKYYSITNLNKTIMLTIKCFRRCDKISKIFVCNKFWQQMALSFLSCEYNGQKQQVNDLKSTWKLKLFKDTLNKLHKVKSKLNALLI